jgi:anti-sigma regulatory factor (Ser/Thr protein kinase)
MTGALIEGEKMRQALEMAREVQMSTLPSVMPTVTSYDACAVFQPAELTGGDTYDLSLLDQGLLIVLGDATGHGIAPALSVTQMQAMLRMAFRLGSDLETAFMQVNNRLAETLAADRFITAFVGLLDPATHRLRFHSGGQGPIFRYQAAGAGWERHKPTSFPLGAMRLSSLRPAIELAMLPGDILVLISDGIYEQCNEAGEQFGDLRVQELVHLHHGKPMAELLAILLESVRRFAGSASQEDDMTAVLVKRDDAGAGAAGRTVHGSFERSFDTLPAMVAFTADTFADLKIDERLLPTVDLAMEELFTNMVKYGGDSRVAVDIDITAIDDGVELTLTDQNVEPFDITQAPDVDIQLPIEQRQPGGLGLHLIRRMVDTIEYEYTKESRRSRITLRTTRSGAAARARASKSEGDHARN